MGVQFQSLWVPAIDMLDKADRKLLDFENTGTDLLESLHKATYEAYARCISRRWELSVPGSKKKIIVRDLLSKIAHWVEVFKSVGDQVVQYDPGHSALPWAGARFLLQLAINDYKKFDFVVQGAERIARMATRYSIIEQLYLNRHSPVTEQLEQSVIRVYNSMLKYLVQAKRYFLEPTGGMLPSSV